ncbi:Pkinase-domain-containing protein [Flagelloscypha sp. PMI_526]|nr:Pkinase-domain-containing protein [Flagelloscypha sp. PMI_526]
MASDEPPFLRKPPRDPKKIGPWKVGRTIGSGAAGRVRIARHSVTGQLAAVKIIPRETFESQSSLSSAAERDSLVLNREIAIMKCVNHPSIMALYDVWETSSSIYLILEYIQGGELFDYICNKGCLETEEALDYFQQIVQAIDYCHKFNIAHRDLKPENILLDQDMNIKIADFGMAAYQQPHSQLETACGSPHYAAPEVVNSEIYDGGPADVWSCGVTLFALLAGRLPFDDDDLEKLLNKVREGVFEMPTDINPLAQDLLAKMLTKDVRERITMEEIQDHPFFLLKTPRHSGIGIPKLNDITSPVIEVDPLIWPNLLTLFYGTPAEELEEDLRKTGPNAPKSLYHLLLDYRTRVLEKQREIEEIKARSSSHSPRRRAITSDETRQSLPPRAAPPTPRRARALLGDRASSSSSLELANARLDSPQHSFVPHGRDNDPSISTSPALPLTPTSPRLWDPLQLPQLKVPSVQDEKMSEFFSQIVSHLNALQVHVSTPASPFAFESPIPPPLGTRPLSIQRKNPRLRIDTATAANKENVRPSPLMDEEYLLIGPRDIPSNDALMTSNRGAKISIREPEKRRSKLRKRHSGCGVSPAISDAPISPWSTMSTSSKRSWISSVFNSFATSKTASSRRILFSTHSAETARSECRRLLMELDVRVALESGESHGVLKCRLVPSQGTAKRNVKFRVEVKSYLGSADFLVYLHFVQEKGSVESFEAVLNEVKRRWTLDGVGSATPSAVKVEPPRLHLRSITT